MRCLVTERRAVFLDTITAYPFESFGRTTVKFVDETRRPLFRADGKSARDRRFRRGNTAGLRGEAFSADSTSFLHDFASGRGLGSGTESVRLRSLSFLRLIGSFRHEINTG